MYEVLASEQVYEGRVISLRRDTVAMPGGGDSVREVVHHPGAVGIVALDDQDRVVLLRQYRHPVGGYLWELPADVHPFFVGTQAHPELKSRPTRPHPLFAAFVHAAIGYQDAARLPVPQDAEMGI